MAIDFSSLPIMRIEGARLRTDGLSTAWRVNSSGRRPGIGQAQRIEVRFNDGRVKLDQQGCIWDTDKADSDNFVGFYRVIGDAAGQTVRPAGPAGVTTEGPDVGSW